MYTVIQKWKEHWKNMFLSVFWIFSEYWSARTHTEKGSVLISYFAQKDKKYKLDSDQKHLPSVSVKRRTEEPCNPDF